MGKITAFCSKNTTEFSEISRWRWSECWGGDSPARHCRFVPATVKTVAANVGERHAAPGDALAVRTNRRQNGNSLRFVIARRPQADVAISGRQLRFRRKYPVIHPGSARLHPKGTSSRFALRAPRRFAPRNDTSGWCRGAPAPLRGLMLLHKAVTDRRYSQTWRRVRSAMACTGCKCLPEIAPQGHFLALRAQGATSLCSSQ